MQLQSGAGQGRQSIIRQRGAHRGTVAAHDLRLFIVLVTLLRPALDPPDAAVRAAATVV
jgi:hypothetical protein